MLCEAVERDGELMIATPWEKMSSEPISYRLFYPTGLDASCFTHLIGKDARYDGCGTYVVGGEVIPLKENEATLPAHRETKPVKRPAWGKSYKDGEWKRY